MSRHLTLWFGGGWLLLIGATALLVVLPAWRRSTQLRSEITSLHQEVVASQDDPDLLEDLSERLDSLRDFGEGRMTPIPQESNIAGLMHALTTILDGKNLLEREIKMGAATDSKRASSIPMTVMIKGEFMSVFGALAEIESMDRLIRVRRLRIGNDNDRARDLDRSGVVEATLTMDVFFAPRDSDEDGEKS